MTNDPTTADQAQARTSKPLSRKWQLCILLGVCGILLLAGLFWWMHRSPDIPLRLWSVAFSPDGRTLVTGGGQDAPESLPQIGEVVIWNAATGKRKKIIQQQWGVRRVAVAPDGRFIATADFGGKTKLLDSGTGTLKAILTPQFSQVNAIAISADSQWIAGGSFDGSITLWDATGKEVETLQAPNERIVNLALSPNREWLVAGCQKGKAYLFNLAQHTPPQVLSAYTGPPTYWSGVEGVAFSPDGQTFATGCVLLRLWKTDTGEMIRELPRAGTARLDALAFSPDGSTLAGVDRAGQLALWNPATGELTQVIQAHAGPSFGLAFSPDGSQLATVDRKEFAIKIWDRQTLSPLRTFFRATHHP